ncbi:GlxA family transcriptional regulator [Roseateles chitinivorans]|uniref:GlxA family transcriptional regulator n=1 Tax=Roseateles chitinivorans TaxID=2917965 RepID=UPI003D66A492
MKNVQFLTMPSTHLLDLAGPLQVIHTVGEMGAGSIDVGCIGPEASVGAFQPLTLTDIRPLPRVLPPDSVLFVIGSKLTPALMRSTAWRRSVDWLRRLGHERPEGLRICGVCSGTFLLADAGLLDGRLCTTHHRFIPRLRAAVPAATVLENRVFVEDGDLLTSAGVTSGIDLALHLVAGAFGEDIAIQVARENVVHFRRFGADPGLSAAMRHRSHCNQRIHAVQDAISSRLGDRVTLDELAAQVSLSGRHLARLFLAETGVSIKQYQIALRMDLARRLMTSSRLSLENIAAACGYGSVQALRANWNRHERLPPSLLRRGAGASRPDA